MKIYFGILLCVTSCISAMDNNSHRDPKQSPVKSFDLKKSDEIKRRPIGQPVSDQDSEQAIKEQLKIMKALYDQPSASSIIAAPIISTHNPVTTDEVNSLSETLKGTDISSPTAASRKLPPLQSCAPRPVVTSTTITKIAPLKFLNDNNNANADSMQIDSEQKITDSSDEDNSEFTQRIQAKNWEKSNKLKKTARLLPNGEYEEAIKEQLIGMKILHERHLIKSEKEEQELILSLQELSQQKSNNNNDNSNDNNNKK